MEKLKVQHDHSLTDILKVLIFAIVLLMPFLVYAPTALYYGFNEHATGTTTVTEGGWEVTPKYKTNEVNNINDLVIDNIYHFDDLTIYSQDGVDFDDYVQFTIVNVENIIFDMNSSRTSVDEIYITEYSNDNANEIQITFNLSQDSDFYLLNTNQNAYTSIYNDNFHSVEFVNVDFKYTGYDNSETYFQFKEILPTASEYQIYSYEYTEEVEVQKNITQMMEKNWDDLWDTNLFKWTDTSILKNGLDNFTQAFGITNTSHINNLIAYELIMVGVYIVIDIVLALFKWLTHMIGNK